MRQRVGPVVSPGKNETKHGWEELTSLTQQLGARALKTWIGAEQPGEGLQMLRTTPLMRIVDQFDVVHLNLSFSYIIKGYQPGTIDPAMLKAARQEWREITEHLLQQASRREQIFLLSVGGELNAYFDTAKAYPGFPVAEFVNACHAGMLDALQSRATEDSPRIYSVAEVQGEIEFARYAEQWVPLFETDLISLSHYTFYRDLTSSLAILQPHVKPLGPFGSDRIMLGEYGPALESCNWNQSAQTQWHDEILRQAHAARMQFAFFYELADQPFVIQASGHHGLIGWSSDDLPQYRASWHYYRAIYQGGKPPIPTSPIYEVSGPCLDDKSSQSANLTVDAINLPPEARAGEAVSFRAAISNAGQLVSGNVAVAFFVDDRMVAWDFLGKLNPGEQATCSSTNQDPAYAWKAIPGQHRVAVVIDPRCLEIDAKRSDNSREAWLNVGNPAAQ